MKINSVRPPADLGDAVPILLSFGLARVLELQAVEPAALIGGVENAARDKCVDPCSEIVGRRDDSSGPLNKRMVYVCVVFGQQGAGPRRSLYLGEYGGVPTMATEALPYK